MHSAKTNDLGCRESVTLLRKYLRLNDDAALFELVGKCCVYLYLTRSFVRKCRWPSCNMTGEVIFFG